MASAAGDPLASAKNLCADILDCCAKIQTVLLKLTESLRRKDAAVRLQAAVRGFLARQRARLLRGSKRTDCTCLHQSEVAAPLLQISTPVAICWEPLAIVPYRDNIMGGHVLVVPLAICPEQQDVILRRGAIMGGAAPTTIRTEPPVIVLLHVSRSVCSWSWLWRAAGKFGGFPWDPGEVSITCISELPGDYEGLEPWPPPDHHSSRASCLRRRGEMSWVGSTVHAVNSIRV